MDTSKYFLCVVRRNIPANKLGAMFLMVQHMIKNKVSKLEFVDFDYDSGDVAIYFIYTEWEIAAFANEGFGTTFILSESLGKKSSYVASFVIKEAPDKFLEEYSAYLYPDEEGVIYLN